MRPYLASVLLLIASLAVGNVARADDVAEKVEGLVADAQAAYGEDDYARSITLLDEAYALYPDPAIRYNMARAYEAHGDCERARWAFRDVMDDEDADPDVRKLAQTGLRSMTCKEDGFALTPVRPAEPWTVPGWAAWTCVGVGAVSVAMGGVLHAVSYETHDELTRLGSDGVNRPEYNDVRSQLEGEILSSRLFYGVGAVLVGTGLLGLLLIDEPVDLAILAVPDGFALQAYAAW